MSIPDAIFSNQSIEFSFSVVFSQLSKPIGADVKNIRASLTSSGILSVEGWRRFLRKLPSSEGAAYDLHVARVINSILLAAPGRSGEELVKTRDMQSSVAQTRIKAWNQSNASRAFLSARNHSWISERPDPLTSDGALVFLGKRRQTLMSDDDAMHAEDVLLFAEIEVQDTEVR
jgi:hypothetical protein